MEFRTTGKERLYFAMFMAGQSLFNQLVNSFSQKFLTEAGIAAAAVGTIILFVRVFDAVNDPLFGGIVDSSNLKSGKFIPWLRISPYLMLIFGVTLFAMPASLPVNAKIIYATVASALFSMAYTICDVPVFSMISAVTDNIQERTHIISRNGIGGAIGLFAMSIAVPALYPRIGWGMTAGAICLIGMAVMMLMFTPDFIEYGEFKTGKRLQGTANSIQTFVCKVMTAAAGAVIMFLMSASGFVSGADVAQSDGALNMIWFLVTLAPAAGCLLSLAVFSRYKLRDKDVQLMAKANSGEITKAEAEAAFSHKY